MQFKNHAGDVVFSTEVVPFKKACEEASEARVYGVCYIPITDLGDADREFLGLGGKGEPTVTTRVAQQAAMRLSFLVSACR